MSYKASAWAVEQTVGDPIAKLVLLTLAESADIERQECFPSLRCLARRTEASPKTVWLKLKYLREKGFIHITRRQRQNGSNTSNLFRLLIHTPCSHGDNTPVVTGTTPCSHGDETSVRHRNRSIRTSKDDAASQASAECVGGVSRDSSEFPKTPEAPKPETARDFIIAWCDRHAKVVGSKYVVADGKDGAAAKRLLKGSGLSVASLLDIAEQAWNAMDHPGAFYARHSAQISTFASQFNAIRQELKNPRSNGKNHREMSPIEKRNTLVCQRSPEDEAANNAAFQRRNDAFLAESRRLAGL